MAKTTVPGLYIADGAITAAKLSSTLDLSGVTITVATASTGDSDTSVASTAFVQQEIAALVDSSPSALNTLNELAAAIGDDASFSTTVTNSIATKLPLAGGTLTGNLIINTTGSIQIPVGTTAQRPTAAQGQLRFNTTTSKPEIYNGSAWADVGGGVESVNSATGVVVLTTANITENTNLYYTDARADARIAAADTDDLSEGSTNLYFTTARANSAFDGRLSGSTGVTVSNGAVSIGQDIATSTSPTFQNLTLSGTDSIKVPSGTTAQRSGSPANGMLRYNSSTNEFEGYADSAWGAIGGDTTSSVDLYTATGNGSTSTYDTGKNPQSENNTWVFIGGVYQPKSTYSFSGTQITLSENLPNGEDLEVITGTVSTYNPTDAILGQYNVTTSNTASYDTSLTTENENNVFVFVDGVYQPKSSYTYSGSTLTLDAVPTSGMSLEVLVTRSMNAATVTTGFLADDAVTTVKILDANVTAGKLASSLDLTGKTVTVATASAGDNDTSVASTAFVRQEITSLVDSAPAAMDTLNELAAALGDDENFSTTVNTNIAAKLPLAGGTMTGALTTRDVTVSDGYILVDGGTTSNTTLEAVLWARSQIGASIPQLNVQGDQWQFGGGGTLDTSPTMTVDYGSGNVGIGTTSPSSELHVKSSGASSDTLTIENSTGNGSWRVKEGGGSNALLQGYNASNSETIRLDPTSDTFFNNGKVGVGTSSPLGSLHVESGSSGASTPSGSGDDLVIRNSHNAGITISTPNTRSGNLFFQDPENTASGYLQYNHADDSMRIGVTDIRRLTIDSSGNVGIGVTPSAWDGAMTALQIDTGSIYANSNGATFIGANFYYDTTSNTNKYIESNPASAIGLSSGRVEFFVAGSGTAGNDVSFTEAMRIHSDGKVGIGSDVVSGPVMGLHVGNGIGALFGPSNAASTYISPDHENTINGGYGYDNDTADLWVNYRGYQNGTSRFRDFRVGDGKENLIAIFEGSSGNVGIGTDDPDARLEVAGSSNTTYLIAGGDDASNGRALTFTSSASANFNGAVHTIRAPSSQGEIAFSTYNTERMRITSGGNVVLGDNSLIGTRPTNSALNIFGDGVTLRFDGSSNATKTILFRSTSASNPGEVYADGGLRLRTEDANMPIMFHTNSTGTNNERMRISGDGSTRFRVGAGFSTTTADSTGSVSISNSDLDSVDQLYESRIGRYLISNGTGWGTPDGRNPGLVIHNDSSATNDRAWPGLMMHNENNTTNAYGPFIGWGAKSASGSFNTTYAMITAKPVGNSNDTNWRAGEMELYTVPVGQYLDTKPGIRITSAGLVQQPKLYDSNGFFWVRNPNQSGQSATTGVVFGTRQQAGSGNYSTSTGRYTTPVDGVYQFNAQVRIDSADASSSGHYMRMAFYTGTSPNAIQNSMSQGHVIHGPGTISGNYFSMSSSWAAYLSAGTQVGVAVLANTGTYDIHGESAFSGYLIG